MSDEDDETQMQPGLVVAPPTDRSDHQPVPGNFSLLKRQDRTATPSSTSLSSATKSPHSKKALANSERNDSVVKGTKSHAKEKDRHPPHVAYEEGKTATGKGGGGRGREGGGGGRGGGRGGREGGGGEGGGKPGEQRFRQSKERHKGNRANHNRRALADRKRDRGMTGPAARY